MRTDEPDETRADVARRRLARLVESFEADLSLREREAAAGSDADGAAEHEVLDDQRERASHPRRRGASRLRLTGTHLRVVVVAAVAGVVVLGATLLAGRPQAADDVPPLTLTGETTSDAGAGGTAAPSDQPAELVIDVIGEVEEPGIVTVPSGSRVHEAIEAAGGLRGTVDTSGINLARVLDDGEQIIVGPLPEGAAAATGPVGAAPGRRIRLNQATAEDLETLPGVGPVTAAAIIAWREENGRFSTVEDLLDVSGIGDVTFGELRDLVVP